MSLRLLKILALAIIIYRFPLAVYSSSYMENGDLKGAQLTIAVGHVS
jgi:hypothetical protein